ncbi:glycosyltransferase family 4 protein [Dysgonomonas sp.]
MKIIVAQYGARRRYLIPQIFFNRGLLLALYTDSYRGSWLGKIAKFLKKIGYKNSSVERLVRRNPQLPSQKIKANDWLQLRLFKYELLGESPNKTIEEIFEGSSKKFIQWGVQNADWLYAMYIENFEFTKYAKENRVKVIADIYENPYIFRELADEIDNNPEFSCIKHLKREHLAQAGLRLKYLDNLLAVADKYIIPSEYVKDALSKSPTFDANKVNIVPYISSTLNDKYDNNPIEGRIIWVGNDPVRKGLVYCLRAINELKKEYPNIDFRVIGPIPSEVAESPYFESLNFIGYLTKEELLNEYRLADMFVFPTLAEGFAGSLLEAASYGVPIITTLASGFSKDFPGIFIDYKDSDAIVRSITKLLKDRELRNKISQDIYEYSHGVDIKSFGDKLTKLFD